MIEESGFAGLLHKVFLIVASLTWQEPLLHNNRAPV
jgi:hypothetical protein